MNLFCFVLHQPVCVLFIVGFITYSMGYLQQYFNNTVYVG